MKLTSLRKPEYLLRTGIIFRRAVTSNRILSAVAGLMVIGSSILRVSIWNAVLKGGKGIFDGRNYRNNAKAKEWSCATFDLPGAGILKIPNGFLLNGQLLNVVGHTFLLQLKCLSGVASLTMISGG